MADPQGPPAPPPSLGGALTPDHLDMLYKSFDDADSARQAIKVARGQAEGVAHPFLQGMNETHLDQLGQYVDQQEAAAKKPSRIQKVAALLQQVGGTPDQQLAQVDMLRGARSGTPDPRLQALQTPADRALADRYAWGANIAQQKPIVGPLALIPPMAYEGVKAVAPGVLGAIGSVLPQGQEMQVNQATSPASMDNIRALIAGYFGRKS